MKIKGVIKFFEPHSNINKIFWSFFFNKKYQSMDGSRIAVLCKVTEQLGLDPAFKQYWHGSVEGCMVLFFFSYPFTREDGRGGRIVEYRIYVYISLLLTFGCYAHVATKLQYQLSSDVFSPWALIRLGEREICWLKPHEDH